MSDLDQFKQTYITESFELLEEMEEKLLDLTPGDSDLEEINAIFRCAHSIKGGGGAFGFSRLVNFTHVVEAVLDAMREDRLTLTEEIMDSLLQSVDVINQLVIAAQEGNELGEDFAVDLQKTLEAIEKSAAGKVGDVPEAAAAPVKTAIKDDKPQTFTITFLPHRTLFESGNEPLLIIRELKRLGDVQVTIDRSQVETLGQVDPQECYLQWELVITTDKGEDAVREVFEFVEDECDLKIESSVPQDDEDEFGGVFGEAMQDIHDAKGDSGEAQDDEDEFGGIFGDAVQEVKQAKTATEVSTQPIKEVAVKEEKAPAAAETGGKKPAVSSMRVDIDKVDQLVNMVGELVITQAMLINHTRDLPPEQFVGLLGEVEELTRHTRNLQEAVMAVRMQPVKSIFARMPRIVRDLSRQLGKKVDIQMYGETTEIDKTVIEQLGDPLTHMIRNSLDHGIEKPEERVAKGKPEMGTIKLSADNSGGRIIIEIGDDGNGINREKVLALAIEKGLVAEDVELEPEEIDNLIFMPGFSTADAVTDVSGRGVGMDVVKRNIEELGGMINLQNYPGEGSNISVSLPLTLAILDGMIIQIGQEYYIIPINNIIESMRPDLGEIKQVQEGCDVLNVRGEYLPILYLHRLFDTPQANTDMDKMLVVLVESGRDKFGLVVDEIVGQQQVVIKSIEQNSDSVKGVSGATILGDGNVSLILDVAQLQQMTVQKSSQTSKQAA